MRTLFLALNLACLAIAACKDKGNSNNGVGGTEADSEDSSSHAGDPCTAGSDPTLRLGFGALEYRDLDPSGEDVAELIHGPQGGFHIDMALAATGLDPALPWTVDLEGTIDGEVMGQTRPLATMRCNRSQNELQTWGLLLIWDATPEELHDQVTDVVATAIDSAGTELSATGTVRIWDPSLE